MWLCWIPKVRIFRSVYSAYPDMQRLIFELYTSNQSFYSRCGDGGGGGAYRRYVPLVVFGIERSFNGKDQNGPGV